MFRTATSGPIRALLCCTIVMLSSTIAAADDDIANRPIPGGSHRDRFGCEVPNVAVPAFTYPPIRVSDVLRPRTPAASADTSKNGIVSKNFSGESELTYRLQRARYFVKQHDLGHAIAEYRIAAALPRGDGDQPSYHDLVTRLPLSATLFRAGRVREARAEWRTVLDNRIADATTHRMPPPPSLPADLFARQRLDLLAERTEPDLWPPYFETGAAQHVARGLDAAKHRRSDAAAFEWRCAVRASPDLQAAHLLLGYAEAFRGKTDAAKNEWIAALEAFPHGPGDMYAVSSVQYDAMSALLRYTGGFPNRNVLEHDGA